METKKLRIGHLYPDLLNMYADSGNVLALQNRLLWRGMEAEVIAFEQGSEIDFETIDIFVLGGGSEREQLLALEELLPQREKLEKYISSGGVFLAICSGYELFGKYFYAGDQKVNGLSLFDIYAEQNTKRQIGNVIISSNVTGNNLKIAGFENHAGKMYIGEHEPLGTVLKGFGNNGEDKTCGMVYKNFIGTYLHGPLLPKNPGLCDALLSRALNRKYQEVISLSKLDDRAEEEALAYSVNRFLK